MRLVDVILKSLDGLMYGSVNITVHDGKITQIDRLEKHRMSPPAALDTVDKHSKVTLNRVERAGM
ncbi:YezD family protein [Alicyclobacillus fastidiosus]|uniref:YezD family protein n=2 Tax=Alicyclobacillus fastidiosus TaxID=392011 RepID=A0ABV5AA01_9BACL|nr:YezD family protein [Alicyclobacillus fastidiosus]WEH12076.1 YezD family protein [Alicyclobacillus fastidiosus]